MSLDGELEEAALWSPASSEEGLRRATVLRSGGAAVSRTDQAAATEPPPVHDVGRYVYEPDPAVIRAHLVSTVVAEIDGWLLDPHLA